MKTIDYTELREILAAVKSATPVGFVAVTDARARKKGNPWAALGGVRKVTRINAMIATDHAKAVERQQAREGIAQPAYAIAERSWGQRLAQSPALVENKGEWYLAAQVNPVFRPRPIYMVPRPRPDGTVRLTVCPKEIVADLLPPDRSAEEAEHQGVERAVIYRNWKLTSLVQISIGGERYRIRQPSAAAVVATPVAPRAVRPAVAATTTA